MTSSAANNARSLAGSCRKAATQAATPTATSAGSSFCQLSAIRMERRMTNPWRKLSIDVKRAKAGIVAAGRESRIFVEVARGGPPMRLGEARRDGLRCREDHGLRHCLEDACVDVCEF